jgi:hypothetical protein
MSYSIFIIAYIGTVESNPTPAIQFSTINNVYTNVTFPSADATFSTTYSATNTSLSINVSGQTGSKVYLNGTYTVSSSSAHNIIYHPCLAFCNTPGSNGWIIRNDSNSWVSTTKIETTTVYEQVSYAPEYRGGSYSNPAVYFFKTDVVNRPGGFSYPGSTTGNIAGEWIQIKLPYSFIVSNISITTMTFLGYYANLRQTFLLGSNDNTNWYYIAFLENINNTTGGPFNFAVSTSSQYTFFRFVCNYLAPNSGGGPQVKSIKLTGTAYIV